METQTANQVTPSKIMQVGLGFWASKTLLTAVNMELFTLLAKGPLSGEQIREKLGLDGRGLYDFLDTLVALGFLKREGLKETAIYSNAEDTDLFLDKSKPSYTGGMLEMANNRLYPFWGTLEDGLKTGKPQNEVKHGDAPLFEVLYSDEARLREFLNAMAGIQMGNFMKFAQEFDFSDYNSMVDIGGAGGQMSTQVALHNPHMRCTTYDLPPVAPIATETINAMNLQDRVTVQVGDFFKEPFPKADVITMGNILHDWSDEEKKMLMKKAYDALPDGGVLVAIEGIIDDNRSGDPFGLMMSLNMLIETPEGSNFSGADFDGWAKEVGFSRTQLMPLTGPSSAAIAYK